MLLEDFVLREKIFHFDHAFGHLKAIGYTKRAMPLLDKAHVVADEGVLELGKPFVAAAGKRYWQREPSIRNLA